MAKYKLGIIVTICLASTFLLSCLKGSDANFVVYSVNPANENVTFYYKNNRNENFGSILNLKNWLSSKNQDLVFATNGGMYKKDRSPQGLFIQNKKELAPIDLKDGNGNFYLKPNGVFYISEDNTPYIAESEAFESSKNIKFATQSGPMLVSNGEIHKSFNKASANLNIRNGVGIMPDNTVVFVMSKKEINFYDFAEYFKSKGCKNALYLDGFVSRTYCPKENWSQTDGDFGVIIAVTKNKK
jgi:uncharacterized protein YigE (DUF2233 family)